jgi:DNA-binding NtrC family response regulator
MITGHSTQRRVTEARDVGVNEFLSKPVTARGVLERIGRVVDSPRPFVRSETYFGPDRRRKTDPSYDGPRRRAADNPDADLPRQDD